MHHLLNETVCVRCIYEGLFLSLYFINYVTMCYEILSSYIIFLYLFLFFAEELTSVIINANSSGTATIKVCFKD